MCAWGNLKTSKKNYIIVWFRRVKVSRNLPVAGFNWKEENKDSSTQNIASVEATWSRCNCEWLGIRCLERPFCRLKLWMCKHKRQARVKVMSWCGEVASQGRDTKGGNQSNDTSLIWEYATIYKTHQGRHIWISNYVTILWLMRRVMCTGSNLQTSKKSSVSKSEGEHKSPSNKLQLARKWKKKKR